MNWLVSDFGIYSITAGVSGVWNCGLMAQQRAGKLIPLCPLQLHMDYRGCPWDTSSSIRGSRELAYGTATTVSATRVKGLKSIVPPTLESAEHSDF